MEGYLTSLSLGEESSQMWALNKRLEAYLSRVKALEEENELLRTEIHTLKKSKSERCWKNKFQVELHKLRDAVDDSHRELVLAERSRDSIWEEVEFVKHMCLQEQQAQEDANKELYESKKLLEEEKRTQSWLKEKLAQLEGELEDILAAHEEEKALVEEEIVSFSQRLENFRVAPVAIKAVDVEDYANRVSAIWHGAVESYKSQVSELEASLSEANDNLKKVQDENKLSKIQLQNLDTELQSLKVRKEMLEELLSRQWQEQQEDEGKLQLEVEALEKEKMELREEIAQVLEDRQQLMHLKMSLSLEVATYRSLLEAESTRMYTPVKDYKISSSFYDSTLEQKNARKRQTESSRKQMSKEYRLSSSKKQEEERKELLWSTPNRLLNVKSTTFKNKTSPVTKEFQKVSSVLQSQDLKYTKASNIKVLPSIESNLKKLPQNEEVLNKNKTITNSYYKGSTKIISEKTERNEITSVPVLHQNTRSADTKEFNKIEVLDNGKSKSSSPNIEDVLIAQLDNTHLETTEKIEQHTSISVLHQNNSSADTNELYKYEVLDSSPNIEDELVVKYEVLDSSPNIEDELVVKIENDHSESTKEVKEKHIDEPSDFVLRDEDISDIHKGYEENIEEKYEEETITKEFLHIKALEDEISNIISLEETCENAENVLSSKHLNEDIIKDRVVSAVIQDIASEIPISEVTIQVIEKDTIGEEVNYQRMHIEKQEELDYKDVEITDKEVSQEGAQVLTIAELSPVNTVANLASSSEVAEISVLKEIRCFQTNTYEHMKIATFSTANDEISEVIMKSLGNSLENELLVAASAEFEPKSDKESDSECQLSSNSQHLVDNISDTYEANKKTDDEEDGVYLCQKEQKHDEVVEASSMQIKEESRLFEDEGRKELNICATEEVNKVFQDNGYNTQLLHGEQVASHLSDANQDQGFELDAESIQQNQEQHKSFELSENEMDNTTNTVQEMPLSYDERKQSLIKADNEELKDNEQIYQQISHSVLSFQPIGDVEFVVCQIDDKQDIQDLNDLEEYEQHSDTEYVERIQQNQEHNSFELIEDELDNSKLTNKVQEIPLSYDEGKQGLIVTEHEELKYDEQAIQQISHSVVSSQPIVDKESVIPQIDDKQDIQDINNAEEFEHHSETEHVESIKKIQEQHKSFELSEDELDSTKLTNMEQETPLSYDEGKQDIIAADNGELKDDEQVFQQISNFLEFSQPTGDVESVVHQIDDKQDIQDINDAEKDEYHSDTEYVYQQHENDNICHLDIKNSEAEGELTFILEKDNIPKDDEESKLGEPGNVGELREEEHIKPSDTIDENILKEVDDQSSYFSKNEVELVNNLELASEERNANSSTERENNIETDVEKSELVTEFEEQYVKTENNLPLTSEPTSENQPLKEWEENNEGELRKEEHNEPSDTIDENILKEGDDQSSYFSENEVELVNKIEQASKEENTNFIIESEKIIKMDLEKSEIIIEEPYAMTENDLPLELEPTNEDHADKGWVEDSAADIKEELSSESADTMNEKSDPISYVSENELEQVSNIELANKEQNIDSSSDSEKIIETDLEKSEIVTEFEEEYVKTENDSLLASETTSEGQPLKEGEADNVGELREEEHIKPADTIDENILKEGDDQSSYFSKNEVELVNNLELASEERNANSSTERENNIETDVEKSELVTEFEEQYVKTENNLPLTSEPTSENQPLKEWEENNEGELRKEEHNEPSDTIDENILKEGDDQSSYFSENEVELVNKIEQASKEENTNFIIESEKIIKMDLDKSEIIIEEPYAMTENDLPLELEPTNEDHADKGWVEDSAADIKEELSSESADTMNEKSDPISYVSENELEQVSNIELANKEQNIDSSSDIEKIIETDLEKSEIVTEFEEEYVKTENDSLLASETTSEGQPLKEGEADNVGELREEEHIKPSDTIDENILKEGDDQSSYFSKNEVELVNNLELASEERNANSSTERENNIETDVEKSELVTEFKEQYVKTENNLLLTSEPTSENQPLKEWEENNEGELRKEEHNKPSDTIDENILKECDDQSSYFSENEVELVNKIEQASKEENTNFIIESEKIIKMDLEKSEIIIEEPYAMTENDLPLELEPTNEDHADKGWVEDSAADIKEELSSESADTMNEKSDPISYVSENELEQVSNIELANKEQNIDSSSDSEKIIETDLEKSEIVTEFEEEYVKTENDLLLASETTSEDQPLKEGEADNVGELREEEHIKPSDTIDENILKEGDDQSSYFSKNEVELVNNLELESEERNANSSTERENNIETDVEKSELVTEFKEQYVKTENNFPLTSEPTSENQPLKEWEENNEGELRKEEHNKPSDTIDENILKEGDDQSSYFSENEVELVNKIEQASKEENTNFIIESEKIIKMDLDKSEIIIEEPYAMTENDLPLELEPTNEDHADKAWVEDSAADIKEELSSESADTMNEKSDPISYVSENALEQVSNIELANKEQNIDSSSDSEKIIETDLEKSEIVTEFEEEYVKTENDLLLASETTSEDQPLKEGEADNVGELREEEHIKPSDTIDENILKEGDDQSSYFSENEVELVNKIEQASKEENTNFIIESEKIIKMDLEKSEIIIEEPYAMTENDLPLELEPTNEDHADKAWVEDSVADIKEELSSESADTMNEKSDPISYVSENALEQVSNIELANKEQNIDSSSDSEKIIETDLEKSEIVTEFEEEYVKTENDLLLASETTSEDQPLKEGEADNVGELREEEHIKPSDTIDENILKEGDDQSSYFSKNEVELVNNLENNLPLTSEPTSEKQPLKEWEENNEGELRKEEHNKPSDTIDENILKEGDDQSSYFSENEVEVVNNIELASKERNANFITESETIETDLEKSEIVTEFEEQYVKTENDFLLASEPTNEDQPLKEWEEDNVGELRKEELIKPSDTIDENILKEGDEQSSYFLENEVELVNNIELASEKRNANFITESETIETDLEKSEIVTEFEEQYVKTENNFLLASEPTNEDQPLKEGEEDNVGELRKEEHIQPSDTIDENILKESDEQSSYFAENEVELVNNIELASKVRNANSGTESENNHETDLEKSEIGTEFEEKYVKTENDFLLASEPTSEDQPLTEWEEDHVGELRKEEHIQPSDTIDENILKESDEQSSYFSENEVELVNNIELASKERNANSGTGSENNHETDLEKSEIVTEFEEQYVKTENDSLLASEPTKEKAVQEWEGNNEAEHKEKTISESADNELELVSKKDLEIEEQNTNSSTVSEKNVIDVEKSEIITKSDEKQYVKSENDLHLALEPTTEDLVYKEWREDNAAELKEEHSNELADTLNENILKEFIDSSSSFSENEAELVSNIELASELKNTNSSPESEKNNEIADYEEKYAESENNLPLATEFTVQNHADNDQEVVEFKEEHSSKIRIIELSAEDLTEINVHHLDYEHKTNILEFSAEVNLVEEQSEFEDSSVNPESSKTENEISESEESANSQEDISFSSQKTADFEISKDYQLEQTLPDTTPLPNLEDEFGDLTVEQAELPLDTPLNDKDTNVFQNKDSFVESLTEDNATTILNQESSFSDDSYSNESKEDTFDGQVTENLASEQEVEESSNSTTKADVDINEVVEIIEKSNVIHGNKDESVDNGLNNIEHFDPETQKLLFDKNVTTGETQAELKQSKVVDTDNEYSLSLAEDSPNTAQISDASENDRNSIIEDNNVNRGLEESEITKLESYKEIQDEEKLFNVESPSASSVTKQTDSSENPLSDSDKKGDHIRNTQCELLNRKDTHEKEAAEQSEHPIKENRIENDISAEKVNGFHENKTVNDELNLSDNILSTHINGEQSGLLHSNENTFENLEGEIADSYTETEEHPILKFGVSQSKSEGLF
ncbi:nestin [Bombina bombina]|uniref:nestin n=1 Tax=Bombina bombina TaxID=8345 RepID=UPI00235A8D2C|nr:nestin [Bombina bombina]